MVIFVSYSISIERQSFVPLWLDKVLFGYNVGVFGKQ